MSGPAVVAYGAPEAAFENMGLSRGVDRTFLETLEEVVFRLWEENKLPSEVEVDVYRRIRILGVHLYQGSDHIALKVEALYPGGSFFVEDDPPGPKKAWGILSELLKRECGYSLPEGGFIFTVWE